MATEAPVKLVRLKVRCADESQFRRELASRIAARLFVPTDTPLAKDDLFALELKFSDGKVYVKGTAKVLKLVDAPKKGVQAKFVSLDADSIQFSLALDFAPFEDSGPIAIDALLPVSGEHPAHDPSPANAAFLDMPTPAPGTVEAAAQARLVQQTKDPFGNLAGTAVYKQPQQDLVQTLKDGGKWSGGLMPLDVLGNYQLLDRLGAGGMAEVYAARATLGSGVEKIVALKVVLPEFGPGTRYGGLFLNEAKISASLAHPGLIQVFDFGDAGGRPYLAMEYLRGRDLATVLKRMRAQGVRVPIGFAVHVVLEVVKALDYLHTRTDPDGRWLHLVHRDVSPGNVLLSENGEVKLVDFGVAAAGAMPGKQLVVGKQTYMPPEQLNGQEPSPGWDLFSAGVVLYEMLTLQPLFEGDTATPSAERFERIEQRPPPSQLNGDVSPNLDAIVLRATHPDKTQRFPSAKQLRDVLQNELGKLAPADVGAIVRSLFGLDLANEKKKLDSTFLDARAARSAGDLSAVSANPVRSMRRAIASTRFARAMARRPKLARALAVAWVALVAFGVYAGLNANTRSRALDEQLERYDAQVASGALSGPGGDTALDHLMSAQRLAPNDPRVGERSKNLGQVFELLADKALARGDDAEAAVHLQALLLADPQRPGIAEKLKATEARVKDRSKPKAPAP